jgi:hypothetical protein
MTTTQSPEKLLSAARLKQIQEAGKAAALAVREQALQRRLEYNLNPNHCLFCQAPILVSLENMKSYVFAETKAKRFCNRSCAGKYNMRDWKSPRHTPKKRICIQCGEEYVLGKGIKATPIRCPKCFGTRMSILTNRTKSECTTEEIRAHARYYVLLKAKPAQCEVCGYTIRIDCCHIKPIKEFPPTALISEINALENLAALCPNHHIELDLGLLKLGRGREN